MPWWNSISLHELWPLSSSDICDFTNIINKIYVTSQKTVRLSYHKYFYWPKLSARKGRITRILSFPTLFKKAILIEWWHWLSEGDHNTQLSWAQSSWTWWAKCASHASDGCHCVRAVIGYNHSIYNWSCRVSIAVPTLIQLGLFSYV